MLFNKIQNNRILIIISSSINIYLIALISWACFHGFEYSDECFYYLGYKYGHELNSHTFHDIYNLFFSRINLTLSEVRLIRLFLVIGATWVLYKGANTILKAKSFSEKTLIFNLLLIGSLWSYSIQPLALSYNSFSTILINIFIGLFLLTLNKQYNANIIFSVILGFLSTLLFYNKITNIAILPLLITSTYIFKQYFSLSDKQINKFIFLFIPIYITGVILGAFLLKDSDSNVILFFKNHIVKSYEFSNSDPSHSFNHILHSYWINIRTEFKKILIPLILFLTLVILSKKSKKIKKFINEHISLSTFNIILAIILVIKNSMWKGGYGRDYSILIPYIYFIITLLIINRKNLSRQSLVLIFSLLSVPLIGSFGSNNGLTAQFLLYGEFIILIIYLLASYAKNNNNSIWIFILVLSSLQITTATLFYPYRMQKRLDANTEITNISNLKGLKVSSSVMNIKFKLNNLEKLEITHVFTLSHQLGIPLLIDKKPFSLNWYNATTDYQICKDIGISSIDFNDVAFLLPSNYSFSDNVLLSFQNKEIDFQNEFIISDKIEYFNPITKSTQELTLYLHKNYNKIYQKAE